MSKYLYTALGHTVRLVDDSVVLLFLSWLDGGWYVIDGRVRYSADAYSELTEREDAALKEAF